MGVDETREVFADVFSNPDFLAEGYGLIYWSHADGWIPYGQASTRWVGQDKGDGDHRMNISELVSVLEGAPHLDFLMFDACFMASVEVAYELRGFTDYYIGSPTENPGPGAPYERLVPLMAADQAAVEMSKAYFAAYEEIYNGGIGISNNNWTGGTSICVMRTDARRCLVCHVDAGLRRRHCLLEHHAQELFPVCRHVLHGGCQRHHPLHPRQQHSARCGLPFYEMVSGCRAGEAGVVTMDRLLFFCNDLCVIVLLLCNIILSLLPALA